MSETGGVIVDTTAGKVSGLTREGVHVFRGIPYAQAPVGTLRFRPPQPPAPWSDVRDATHAARIAPQLPSPMEQLFQGREVAMGEDCLALNVYTPGLDDARRPVMFWIHGGAFVNGAGSTPWYDGRKFATHGDVVVVTINYRLGALGFLHLADVAGDRFVGSGNCGILDQVLALEWVRDNIASFGGDPASVTIFGESAGAMSVGTLLGLPAAQDLFHRAILQSGASSFAATPDQADKITRKFVRAAGLEARDAAELLDLPLERILAAQEEVLGGTHGTALQFQPVVDGTVLRERAIDAISAGSTGDVATLVGTTRDEMTLFLLLDPSLGELDGHALVARTAEMLGEGAGALVERYRRNRPGESLRDVLVAITSDWTFRIPGIRLAEAQTRHGRPAYSYLFTWASPAFGGLLKSCHALELPFVWDNLDSAGVDVFTGDGAERHALATAMHEAWTAFARTGNPGWPRYDLERRATQIYDGAENPVLDDPMADERALWDHLA